MVLALIVYPLRNFENRADCFGAGLVLIGSPLLDSLDQHLGADVFHRLLGFELGREPVLNMRIVRTFWPDGNEHFFARDGAGGADVDKGCWHYSLEFWRANAPLPRILARPHIPALEKRGAGRQWYGARMKCCLCPVHHSALRHAARLIAIW